MSDINELLAQEKQQDGTFIKECPSCHETQIYSSIKTFRRAVKADCICLECSINLRKQKTLEKGKPDWLIKNEERKKKTDEKNQNKKYTAICTKCKERPVGTSDKNKYEQKINLGIWLCQGCSFTPTEKGKFKHVSKLKLEEQDWIEKNGSVFQRKCPVCEEVIIYSTYKKLKSRLEANTPCNRCSTIAFANSNAGKKQLSEMGKRSGEAYRHGIESGERERRGLSPETREQIRITTKDNGLGLKAGWRCKYKNASLDSLFELSYIINVLEANGENWISAGKKQFAIPYLKKCGDLEIWRKYYPDFVLPNKKIIIECKPPQHMNDENVLRKRDAALEWCSKNGYTYQFASIERKDYFTINDFYDMWQNNIIEISEITKEKLLNIFERRKAKKNDKRRSN